MLQRLIGEMPAWARRDNPLLRYELSRGHTATAAQQVFRMVWLVVAVALLFIVGYLVATGFFAHPAGQYLTESLFNILYWPQWAVQMLASILAVTLTGSIVSVAVQRQVWDTLRATSNGAGLTVRTRWVAVLYRLRGLLAVMLAVRLVFVVGVLIDLTAFYGRYLDLLITGIVPQVNFVIAAVLLAVTLTVGVLLPLTTLAFDAAIGLLIATVFQQRATVALLHVLYLVFRLGLSIGLLAVVEFARSGRLLMDGGGWGLALALPLMADSGASFLNLTLLSEQWAQLPYGIFLGVVLLLLLLVQAAITDRLVTAAANQAERRG